MTTCSTNMMSEDAVPGERGRPCGKPATVTVKYGCVHEHISTALLCDYHAQGIISGEPLQSCTKCWNDAGHRCRLLGRVVVPS